MPRLWHRPAHDSVFAENRETLHWLHQLFQGKMRNLLSSPPAGNSEASTKKLSGLRMAAVRRAIEGQETMGTLLQSQLSAKGEKILKCKICDKEAVDAYCELHEKAYKNLMKKYEVWKKALDISWKDYLKEVAKNTHTGSWVKEVAEQLMKSKGG